MEQLFKRIRSGLWIALAGFIVAVVGLVLDNLDALNLTESQGKVAFIIGTAVISQITKYLNSAKK